MIFNHLFCLTTDCSCVVKKKPTDYKDFRSAEASQAPFFTYFFCCVPFHYWKTHQFSPRLLCWMRRNPGHRRGGLIKTELIPASSRDGDGEGFGLVLQLGLHSPSLSGLKASRNQSSINPLLYHPASPLTPYHIIICWQD